MFKGLTGYKLSYSLYGYKVFCIIAFVDGSVPIFFFELVWLEHMDCEYHYPNYTNQRRVATTDKAVGLTK